MEELNRAVDNTNENIEVIIEEFINREELVCTGDGCAGNACGVYQFP